MKKIFAIIAVVLILTSCSKPSESKGSTIPESKGITTVEAATKSVQQENTVPSKKENTNNQGNNESSDFRQYQMSNEGFSQYINDNAIDKDYKIELDKFQAAPEFNTQGNESEFVNQAWYDLGLGSQGRLQQAMQVKDRIRNRTLQLMEYYHMLGGQVEFLYE